MTFVLLRVKHIQQRVRGECVAACSAMALDYIGLSASYDRLLKLLKAFISTIQHTLTLRCWSRVETLAWHGWSATKSMPRSSGEIDLEMRYVHPKSWPLRN